MNITQISVFLENKKGRLAELTGLLSREGVNIRALSLADTADFGVLRLIVNEPGRCLSALKANQFVAQQTEVLAVEVEDRPGGLHKVLDVLNQADINIEYMYAFVEKKVENAIVVFKVGEPQKAVEALGRKEVSVLSPDVIENL